MSIAAIAALNGLLRTLEEERESGLFDLPKETKKCNHPEHEPPKNLYIPQGKGYKHVCPGCKKESVIIPLQISF